MRHGHVGLAAEHGGQRFLRLHLGQVQPHLRRRTRQRRPRRGHEARGGGRERGQRDPPRDLVAQRGQVGFGRVQPGQQGVGVPDQDHRGRGELEPTPGPFGQPDPDLALQGGQLLGDGGRRVAERHGSRGHRPSNGLGFGASALIVLAAAVLQAIFHTAQKPLLARYTGFEVTAYAMWAGTAFILPWTGSPAAGAAAGRRPGHRRGRLPGPRAVGGRFRAVGVRHGAAGRRAGHPQPLPGPGGRDRHRAGLARPGARPGRTGRRGDRPRRRHPGQVPERPALPLQCRPGSARTGGGQTSQTRSGEEVRCPGGRRAPRGGAALR